MMRHYEGWQECSVKWKVLDVNAQCQFWGLEESKNLNTRAVYFFAAFGKKSLLLGVFEQTQHTRVPFVT